MDEDDRLEDRSDERLDKLAKYWVGMLRGGSQDGMSLPFLSDESWEMLPREITFRFSGPHKSTPDNYAISGPPVMLSFDLDRTEIYRLTDAETKTVRDRIIRFATYTELGLIEKSTSESDDQIGEEGDNG